MRLRATQLDVTGAGGKKPSGSLLLYPAYVQDYLDRVTAADVAAGDTAGLERGVTDAFNQVLQDMVSDQALGISGGIIAQAPSIIKAMPFMVGARTLPGCLVPVVGPAPTNYNFVPPDYNRKTGLLGDGATTYLSSNRNNNADPQDSKHISFYKQAGVSSSEAFIGIPTASIGGSWFVYSNSQTFTRVNASTSVNPVFSYSTNSFYGANRGSSTAIQIRGEGSTSQVSVSSASPANANIEIFGGPGVNRSQQRIAFYSIGESLDLALLDARVTTLINAIAAALP